VTINLHGVIARRKEAAGREKSEGYRFGYLSRSIVAAVGGVGDNNENPNNSGNSSNNNNNNNNKNNNNSHKTVHVRSMQNCSSTLAL